MLGLGVLLAAPALLLPHAGDRLSRRSALLGGAAALTVTLPNSPARAVELPTYDEEGRVINKAGYEEETGFRSVSGKDDAASSVQLLSSWKWEPSGELIDPVQGSTATLLQFSAKASELQGIKDLGKPENLPVVRALGLDPELERADMVAAALRTSGGTTFYEYDLALPATKCDAEMATVCLPSKIVLLSSCVRDATLHVIRVEADIRQWKLAGKALKRIRSSFAVDAAAPPGSAPPTVRADRRIAPSARRIADRWPAAPRPARRGTRPCSTSSKPSWDPGVCPCP